MLARCSRKHEDIMTNNAKAKGGRARAEALSPEARKDIARRAANSRWNKGVPEAMYGSPDRPLQIGGTEIQCFVLDDETRVLTQGSFLEAIGRHRRPNTKPQTGEERVPAILQGKAIHPFITSELLEKSQPVSFRTGSALALGYRAEILPMVCEVYLQARDAKALPPNQRHVAVQAEILMRALAHVGIIALVDEATGYQDVRARNALNEILEQFIADELRRWTKMFPDDFYRQMFRLRGWEWKVQSIKQRPGVVGKYTNDLVYQRLAPGVLDELRRKNPSQPGGRRKHKHHQWLNEDIGDPKLREHLASVITLMRASSEWTQFKRLIDRALPRFGNTIEMQLDD